MRDKSKRRRKMTMRKRAFLLLARAFPMVQTTMSLVVDPLLDVLRVKAKGIDVMVKATVLTTPVMGPQRRAAVVIVATRRRLIEH